MNPPAGSGTSFSGRRRSSVITPNITTGVSPTSVAPRKASTWDAPPSIPSPHGSQTASDISSRRASVNTADTPSQYSSAGSIAGRRASSWEAVDPPAARGAVSASDIAGRKATTMDRPPWDSFAGAPPSYAGSTWAWMSEITTMLSNPNQDRRQVFYGGNINYIVDAYNGKRMAIEDLRAILQAYGANEASAEQSLKKVDPKGQGVFSINSQSKQILLDSNITFSHPSDPLHNLRQGSKCFEKDLLSPLHFAGYIIDILKGQYLGFEPRFMILGMYSILGLLYSSHNSELTTKDVETFVGMWRVNNPDEARELVHFIDEDYNGNINCNYFYNLLYGRNAFGKQRIQMFDTTGHKDPTLFFPVMDKDDDGFISAADLRRFASVFGRSPSDEAIRRTILKLDMDGDGEINREDFRQAMMPILDGMTWEFWLAAILFTLQL